MRLGPTGPPFYNIYIDIINLADKALRAHSGDLARDVRSPVFFNLLYLSYH